MTINAPSKKAHLGRLLPIIVGGHNVVATGSAASVLGFQKLIHGLKIELLFVLHKLHSRPMSNRWRPGNGCDRATGPNTLTWSSDLARWGT